jgi:hypothetical protein
LPKRSQGLGIGEGGKSTYDMQRQITVSIEHLEFFAIGELHQDLDNIRMGHSGLVRVVSISVFIYCRIRCHPQGNRGLAVRFLLEHLIDLFFVKEFEKLTNFCRISGEPATRRNDMVDYVLPFFIESARICAFSKKELDDLRFTDSHCDMERRQSRCVFVFEKIRSNAEKILDQRNVLRLLRFRRLPKDGAMDNEIICNVLV